MSTGTAELVIEGRQKIRVVESFRELWAYRSTVAAFAERNIRVAYKQAVLGVAWAIVQPLTTVVVFTIILGHLLGISGGGVSYAAFALSAQLPWGFLNSVVSGAASSSLGNVGLMRKVYFPREVPAVAAVFSAAVNFTIVFALFLVLGPILGAHMSAWLVMVVPLAVPVAILALGVGLALGALNVYYRDFGYVLGFFMQLWFYASPVTYPLTQVPEQWRPLYVAVNPAVGLMDAFRHVMTLGTAPNWGLLGISLVQTGVVATLGFLVFKRLERLFADVA